MLMTDFYDYRKGKTETLKGLEWTVTLIDKPRKVVEQEISCCVSCSAALQRLVDIHSLISSENETGICPPIPAMIMRLIYGASRQRKHEKTEYGIRSSTILVQIRNQRCEHGK